MALFTEHIATTYTPGWIEYSIERKDIGDVQRGVIIVSFSPQCLGITALFHGTYRNYMYPGMD